MLVVVAGTSDNPVAVPASVLERVTTLDGRAVAFSMSLDVPLVPRVVLLTCSQQKDKKQVEDRINQK